MLNVESVVVVCIIHTIDFVCILYGFAILKFRASHLYFVLCSTVLFSFICVRSNFFMCPVLYFIDSSFGSIVIFLNTQILPID